MSDATATLRIKTVMDSSDAISNINTIQKALKDLKMPKDMTKGIDAQLEEIISLTKQYQNLLEKPNKSNADLRQLDQLEKRLQSANEKAVKLIKDIDFSKINTNEIHTEAIDKLVAKLEKAQEKLREIGKQKMNTKGIQKSLAGLDATIGANASKTSKSRERLDNLKIAIDNGDLKQALELARELETKNNSLVGRKKNPILWAQAAQSDLAELVRYLDELAQKEDEAGGKSAKLKSEISGISSEIAQLRADEMNKMAAGAEEVAKGLSHAADEANSYNSSMNGAIRRQTEMQQQVQNLQQQIKNYFGLDEVFRKIGDLARQAMDTVKELDAAMTETAVVTNFSVSDMWKMLPTYTKNANALGSTIADVYNAATLYYQQGLTTSQSMALANETLKMARIGGIEAAEATDMMTAALRGFNMEINQASAQKINDVYSKLAAITAADTKEIGSAMERTASIASSANMDFETTSAFLSQMIETTREAPENLGTAMKTIIARFQELKVDPNSLVDSEGEALDFNRVDKALKTIGVSLVDTQGQFRDLDDVFLEIASRWDGLSQAQQRYIATMAAGSRQQSRFIAMMQDYDRTMELVDAAYTAEGAGQAQFEKTLESMDSKLNRLKNAWDQFVMGLMNADFLKKGVDIATGFLDIFEKIINTISKIGVVDPLQGLIKSALTATAVFGGLIGMSKLLVGAVGKFAGIVLNKNVLEKGNGFFSLAYQSSKGSEETQAKRKVAEDERARIKEIGKEQSRIRHEAYKNAVYKDPFYDKENDKIKHGSIDLDAGARAQKDYKQLTKNIQKQFQSNNGIIDAKSLANSFSGIDQSVSKAVAPQLAEALEAAFRKGAAEANIDITPELEQKLQANLSNLKKGKIGAEEAINNTISNAEEGGFTLNTEEITKGAKNVAPLAEHFDKVGNAAMNAGQSIQMFGANLQGTPLAPFGSALMIVGQGLENIGMLMSSGLKSIKTFGINMVAAGVGAETMTAAEVAALGPTAALQAGFKGLATTIWEVLSPLLPVIAAIGAFVAIAALVYKAATTDERALKAQGDAAAQASQDLDTCKQALEAVNNDLEELANNDSQLDNLVKGTTEWNSALAESNAHIIEMMKNYETLNTIGKNGEYKYIKTDKDGRMSITPEGQKAIQEEYQKAVNLATANNAIQTALHNNLKDLYSEENKEAVKTMTRADAYGIADNVNSEYAQAALLHTNIADTNKAREDQAWKTGIHSVIEDMNLSNQESVENILNKQREQYLKDNEIGLNETQTDLETEYAKLMSYTRKDDETYEDAQGNEITVDFDTVKEELPELRTLKEMGDRAEDTSNALVDMDKDFSNFTNKAYDEDILSDIMADSIDVDADQLSKLVSGDNSQIDRFIKSLEMKEGEFDKDRARDLEDLLGLEKDSIKDVEDFNNALDDYQSALEEHTSKLLETQKENVGAVAAILSQSGQFDDKTIKKWTSGKGGDEAFSNTEMNKLSTIADQMGDNLGGKAAEKFVADMAGGFQYKAGKYSGGLTERSRKIIEDQLVGVDFSNSLQFIDAYDQLGKTKGVGSQGVKKYAEEVKSSLDYAKQSALALQQTLTSTDLEDALKDIKLDETNGKYTGKAIQEAAESSQSLATYLEASGISASSFANIMNKMASADLDIADLTPSVVAFANAMDQVGEATSSALRAIENFKPGEDFGSVDDFAKTTRDTIQELAENHEWGNPQMASYFDQYFGEGKFEEYARAQGSYYKAYKSYSNKLNQIITKDGDFNVEAGRKIIKNAENTTEALEKLQKKYNLSEAGAQEFLTAIINKSSKLGLKLEKGDIGEAYTEFSRINKETAKETGLKDQQVISVADLSRTRSLVPKEQRTEFWQAYADDISKGIKGGLNTKQKEQLIQYGGELHKAYQSYITDGLSKEEYNNQVNTTLDNMLEKGLITKTQRKNFITTDANSSPRDIIEQVNTTYGKRAGWNVKEDRNIDLEKTYKQILSASGGDQNTADAVLKKYIKENDLQNKKFQYQGQYVKGSEIETEGASAIMQTLTDKNQWTTVGETIGKAFVDAWNNRNKGKDKDKDKDKEDNSPNKLWTKIKEHTKGAFEGKEKTPEKSATESINKLQDSNIGKHWAKNYQLQQTSNNGKVDRATQVADLNNYLKGTISSLKPEAQAKATDKLVEKLNSFNFSKEELASAISSATKKNFTANDFNGKEGKLKINWDSLNPAVQSIKGVEESVHNSAEKGMQDLSGTGTVHISSVVFGGGTLGKANKGGAKEYKGVNAHGQNNYHLGTFARGSRSGYTIPGRPTLTGEEGEELVWEPKQNAAYMVGTNGPQFANISRDAVVWNADQTKRIKKNSNTSKFGLGARGIKPVGSMALGAPPQKRSSGGGGASISGQLSIDAVANIVDVKEPESPKTIPVYADVKVKGEEKGGLWNKIKGLVGGKDGNKTIPVTAQITKTVNKTKKSVKGIKATATVTKVRKAGTVNGEPVKVKASATVNTVAKTDSASGAISNLASAANSTQTMTVKANTNAAETKVRNLVNSINSQKASVKVSASPDSLSVPVKLVYDGSWSKTITFKKAAEGMNYKKYNSYAGGTPKAKGGLTLTGEEGYEVVWMPGQKQSMIVGVNGPQMLELPPDAVVWPHEQSKKILKNNKGIPAQSYAKGSKERKTAKKGYKAGIYTTEKREAGFFKWIASIENSEKKIEKWGKSLDKASDAAERYAKQVGGNSKTLFDKEVSKQFSLLSKQLKAANSELKLAGKATNAINKSRKKTTISYNLDSAKDSPSKEFYVKEGALVNRNKNGELTINEKGIRKTARKRGKTAFQVNQIITEMRSAAQSLVDEYNGHLESAKDLQDEVKQKQRELRDSIKETFYEFEHDLDRIKELQSNISLFDSFESRVSAIQSYLDSKMKAGFATSKQTIGQYTKFLEQQADNLLNKITAQRDLTNLATATLSNDTKTYDEYKAWKNAQSATAKAKKYGANSSQYQKALAEEEYRKQEYDRVVLGSKYVKVGKDSSTGQLTVTLNEGKLADAKLKAEDYQAVKDYYENILQKVQDINQGVADVHSGIASAYDQITSAYTDVDNFAKNVINGMQESEQETIDSLKTLNESLRDAFSDLIDNVRKELDKQRKAEQNQKTEKDITDKMNRLAMLRADTSGSNAAEIAQLEKEITEATGDYEDSLEDQLLDRLQDDADKAAEQRERQISVLEEQLEYTKAIGQYVTRAENLVQKYINGTATAAEEAELRSYYMLGANGKDPMTKWGKWLAEGEFESAATKVKTFNSTIEKLTNTIKSLEEVLANLKTNPTIGDTNAQQAEQLAGQMKEAGKSAQEVYSKLKEKGLNDSQIAKEMRKAGYTGAQAAAVKDLSAKELRAGGYSAKDLASSKAAKTLLKAGYTYKEIAPYYGAKELQKAAADTGTTNKAKDFGGGKTKLAGTAKTVTTYKSKKGKTVDIKDTTGTFTEGGNVAFAKGSQVWYKNSKTGKVTKKYPLNKFTKAQISPKNAEYKEFAQAIKFAMTNNKVGSKVPGLVTALKTAISTGAWKKAGYNKGWDLKGTKAKGSAGSNGLVYYNSGDAVKTWNPSNGNINTIKYNKAEFAKKAALTYVGREYANAREYHKKKYKKYLAGGLANYTGPAWMDGTPSKPELVLNATDTKNFMALKDILSEAAKRGAFSRKEENISQGDMTFDININVDKIDNDYDVDKVAKRVEKIITTKAKTRNVTVVGRSR